MRCARDSGLGLHGHPSFFHFQSATSSGAFFLCVFHLTASFPRYREFRSQVTTVTGILWTLSRSAPSRKTSEMFRPAIQAGSPVLDRSPFAGQATFKKTFCTCRSAERVVKIRYRIFEGMTIFPISAGRIVPCVLLFCFFRRDVLKGDH